MEKRDNNNNNNSRTIVEKVLNSKVLNSKLLAFRVKAAPYNPKLQQYIMSITVYLCITAVIRL